VNQNNGVKEMVFDNNLFQGITIDGDSSKDLDDAIWVEKTEAGYKIQVLISDVSSIVRVGSSIDDRASEMQFSIYRGKGGCVKSMLPRSLSEDKLSLLKDRERKVVVYGITLDENLDCINRSVSQGSFVNNNRLTHSDVTDILEDESNSLNSTLSMMADIANCLLAKRRESGALMIYDIVAGWGVNEDGTIRKLSNIEKHIGHVIVQEFMVLANTQMSIYCIENDIPVLFRNHIPKSAAPPASEIINEIEKGISSGDGKYLESVSKRTALIAGKAEMGVSVKGHYGLNVEAYAYFTSPIRRFPDLVTQRNLLAYIQGKEYIYNTGALEKFARDYNERITELKEETTIFFKSKADETGLRNLNGKKFGELTSQELYRAMKVAVDGGHEISFPLQKELLERMKTQCLDHKIIALIFSKAHEQMDSDLLCSIGTELYTAPHNAISVQNVMTQKYGALPFEYEESTFGPDHSRSFKCRVFTVDGKGKVVQSREIIESSKKKASQVAVVDLLCSMIGLTPEIPKDFRLVEPKKSVPDLKLRDDQNPKVILQEWCQKQGVEIPAYTVQNIGDDKKPIFEAVVKVDLGKSPVRSTGASADSKKTAERNAAKEWIVSYGVSQEKNIAR